MKTTTTAFGKAMIAGLALGGVLGGGVLRADGQELTMSRHVIAGGGGSSAGGAFTLSGTVGQPDAGQALTGGAYSLTGGFWALPTALQTPGAPRLEISVAENLVVVSWPRAGAEGFVLERKPGVTAGLIPTPWIQVPFPYQTNATHIFITTPPDGDGFFRLRKP